MQNALDFLHGLQLVILKKQIAYNNKHSNCIGKELGEIL